MLRVENLEVAYGDFQVLWGVSLEVHEGEIVCLLGPNGAGKSTILNTISGLRKPKAGTLTFCGRTLASLRTHQIVALGLAHVLERRRVFPYLTVLQNLQLGAYAKVPKAQRQERLEWVYSLFPILARRQQQLAGTLSGGEQQMLAIGRGLMANPKLLMIDEPFLGLAPAIVAEICEIIKKINGLGISVLFIEQNVQLALSLAHRGYVLESGRMVLTGSGKALLQNPEIKKVYLGL